MPDNAIFNKALRHNINLQVPYIILTNGGYSYGFKTVDNALVEIKNYRSNKHNICKSFI